MSIVITHNAGFFSCCSVKLNKIVDFINVNEKTPDAVDSSQQFEWYKTNKDEDITYDYFEHYNNIKNIEIECPINYHWDHQYLNYSDIDTIQT